MGYHSLPFLFSFFIFLLQTCCLTLGQNFLKLLDQELISYCYSSVLVLLRLFKLVRFCGQVRELWMWDKLYRTFLLKHWPRPYDLCAYQWHYIGIILYSLYWHFVILSVQSLLTSFND